jgi:hypothetical protein
VQFDVTVPTLKDRVVQMALKLVLEPIFESGFYPSSHAYRPGRRAQDAIAEIVQFTKTSLHYEWVIETDVEACFDRLSHSLILEEVRRRIGDTRVLALVRSFLKAAPCMTRPTDVLIESRMRGNSHVRFGGRRRGDHRPKGRHRRLAADPACQVRSQARSRPWRSGSFRRPRRSWAGPEAGSR